ncbi:glycosyltransferase family 4 protein [Kocuria sp. CNJ-770]|uniref:glycosyltransferase family 4 protein n=1 Tax=Kocuria sp. CNJ-770 TaxID=1904964 RepID=UPI0009F91C78|nr:glycosyltransferase family 4 protein [Kocuria sp. CNJ-770]
MEIYDGYAGRVHRERHENAEILRLRQYVPRRPSLVTRTLMELHFGLKAALTDWGDPDVVLLVSPAMFSTALCSLAAKLRHRGVPTVTWVQDLYSRGVEESHSSAAVVAPIMRAIEGAALSSARRTIVIHDRFRQHVVDRLNVPGDRVQVVRNWTHITPQTSVDRDGVRRRLGWAPDRTVVLHAGNMGVKQGLDNVVEAARLAEMQGSSLQFVLMGDGNQRRHLEELGRGVANLQFLDPLPNDEYAAALASADVLLVNELAGVKDMSVPSKLTSYFVTGRPVLAAVERESATAGEVEASGAGRVVPSDDPCHLLGAAKEMSMDPAAATALGAQGPSYAAAHLSAEAAMGRWDDVLRTLTQHVRR